MNYENPYDHAPNIERNNQLVHEQFRIAYYRLPYKKIPRLMIRHLAMIDATKLNLFPAEESIPGYYSTHMILNQRNWDYKNIGSINLVHMFRKVKWKSQQIHGIHLWQCQPIWIILAEDHNQLA